MTPGALWQWVNTHTPTLQPIALACALIAAVGAFLVVSSLGLFSRRGPRVQIDPRRISLEAEQERIEGITRETGTLFERALAPMADAAFQRTSLSEREWVERLYSFAVHPDITFYFRVPLEISLNRILEGRPQLKYHEAGLDMGWSTDPYESFRIFQGKVHDEYEKMLKQFDFTVVDATREIHEQQNEVRRLISERIDLPAFRRSPDR